LVELKNGAHHAVTLVRGFLLCNLSNQFDGACWGLL